MPLFVISEMYFYVFCYCIGTFCQNGHWDASNTIIENYTWQDCLYGIRVIIMGGMSNILWAVSIHITDEEEAQPSPVEVDYTETNTV